MALDSVEPVMSFEEEFSIEISDGDAEKMYTVGDVVDYVSAALVRRGDTPNPADIFLRVRRRTVDILNRDPEKITRSSRFIENLGLN
jgi:acyl carrier protein